MRLYPEVKYKGIETCEVGELIRPSFAGGPLSILIGSQSGERGLLLLEGTDSEITPPYTMECVQSFSALSYGKNFSIEIVEGGPREVEKDTLYRLNGGVWVAKDRWLLRTRTTAFISAPRFVDLTTGLLCHTPPTHHVTFAHWDLRLQIYGDARDPIIFSHRPKTS